MKKVLLGLIIGITLSVFSVVLAEEFTASSASFPIFVNGTVFKSDKPAVVIDGSTYLPLKAIGDALNVKVTWNDSKNQVEIGEQSPVTNQQYSYNNPAKVGTTQLVEVTEFDETQKFEITLNKITRGENALLSLKNNDEYTKDPQEGYEYLIANITFKPLMLKAGTCYNLVGGSQFKLISQDGKEYDTCYTFAKDYLETNLYEGAKTTGTVVFEVKKDDTAPKLTFGRNYDGTGGAWFKAYQD